MAADIGGSSRGLLIGLFEGDDSAVLAVARPTALSQRRVPPQSRTAALVAQAAVTVVSEVGEESEPAAPPGAKPAGASLVEGIPAQALDFVLEVQFLTLEFGDAQIVAGKGLHRVVKLALEGFVLGGELAQMRLQGHEGSLLSQFPTAVDWHRMERVSKPFDGKVDAPLTR
ncbi:hypothetical protein J2W76_001089 [Methylorubrum zatmanii]|nr:hypothetical protein [Methylorubrum zatmanii]MCP1555541.1 hypothetical protein [Methylorubrum extorquens]MCP1578147.1 hypothetical protein [Methylorubrum extorquens]